MNIIDGFQKKWLKIIELFLTSMGWILMIGYIVEIILTILIWLFNLSNFYKLLVFLNIRKTINTLIITFAISILAFLIMFIWGKYNYKRYAHLNRRKFPNDVTSNEIVEYFNLPHELVTSMQNDKEIELEKTIV